MNVYNWARKYVFVECHEPMFTIGRVNMFMQNNNTSPAKIEIGQRMTFRFIN